MFKISKEFHEFIVYWQTTFGHTFLDLVEQKILIIVQKKKQKNSQ